jgi:hypothetical protein
MRDIYTGDIAELTRKVHKHEFKLPDCSNPIPMDVVVKCSEPSCASTMTFMAWEGVCDINMSDCEVVADIEQGLSK